MAKANAGSDGTPTPSFSLETRLMESSKKKRKASPLKTQISTESQEMEAIELVRESLTELAATVNKLDVSKGQEKIFMDAVRTALTRLDEYTELRLTHNYGPSPAVEEKPPMKDASTDMDLTPEWWIPTRPVSLNRSGPPEKKQSKVVPKSYAEVSTHRSTAAVETEDDEEPFKLVERRRRKSLQPPVVVPTVKRPLQKPPAILIKVPSGGTYAETVKTVKGAVNPKEIGVDIAAMRRTREGHLLLEVRGDDAAASAERLKDAVADRAGTQIGGIVGLGSRVVAEVLGLDPTVDEEEVRTALQDAITCRSDDSSSATEAESVVITGLWPIKAGTQIATATMSTSALGRLVKIGKIPVGWTMVRVRQRDEPPRCYRCHGFGHTSGACTGPDLSGTCRRCGETGHREKSCSAADKICVACERAGITMEAHRPGSARCGAKKSAVQHLQKRTVRGQQQLK